MPLPNGRVTGAADASVTIRGRRGKHANMVSRGDGILGSGDGGRDLAQSEQRPRSWVSLRHRLHETLVESGTRGIERLQSLPKMSELVTTMRGDVSPKAFVLPIEALQAVKKLCASDEYGRLFCDTQFSFVSGAVRRTQNVSTPTQSTMLCSTPQPIVIHPGVRGLYG